MEVSDLAGLAEPLKKLVEVVAQGVGGFSKSYLIRKNADAKAYEIKQLAEANKYKMGREAEAILEARRLLGNVEYVKGKLILTAESEQSVLPLPERIEDRKQYQEAKEQQNIEEITCIAAEELANEERVSGEAVNDDWIARFFDAARLINDEQMQVLWGKILAGEIKQPHSYSLRTLELLKNLTKDEAEIFVKVAKLAIREENSFFVVSHNRGRYLQENYNISFEDWLLLDELGLVNFQDLVTSFDDRAENTNLVYSFGDIVIIIENPNPHTEIPIKAFTTTGSELARLVTKEANEVYLHELVDILNQFGSPVKHCKIIEISTNGTVIYSDLQEFDFSSNDDTKQ